METGLRRLALEGRLGLFEDGIKRGGIVDGEIGKDLAVDLDTSGGEALDKSAVGQAAISHGRTDALDPEAAELPLLLLAIVVLVLLGLVDGVLGIAEELGAETPEALGPKEDALAALATGGAVCGTWHAGIFL